MTEDTLVVEQPAFVRHQKFQKSMKERRGNKRLFDCCFSLSNLFLIIGSTFAFVNAVKFLYDEPLYDQGDHLLSIVFYRQITYIIAVLPLVLIIPIYNAVDAVFLASLNGTDLASALLTIKFGYQVLVGILAFVGLVFVAPSIRSSSVSSQLESELRTHLKRRYRDEFSYNFIDAIQTEYKCCDELWYRSNHFNKLPLSCYDDDDIHPITCADALGILVSNRCAIIAVSIVAILVALAFLGGSDLISLLDRQEGNSYELRSTPEVRSQSSGWQRVRTSEVAEEPSRQDDWMQSNVESGLLDRLREEDGGERGIRRHPKLASFEYFADSNEDLSVGARLPKEPNDVQRRNESSQRPIISDPVPNEAPILARAKYAVTYNGRPKSPFFINNDEGFGTNSTTKRNASPSSHQEQEPKPVRSVLKKVSSYTRIDDNGESGYSWRGGETPEPGLRDQSRSPSVTSTRRSLLNVRFADE